MQLVLSAYAAAMKSLPVLQHCVGYIFWSSGINELILGCFEYTELLKVLQGVAGWRGWGGGGVSNFAFAWT